MAETVFVSLFQITSAPSSSKILLTGTSVLPSIMTGETSVVSGLLSTVMFIAAKADVEINADINTESVNTLNFINYLLILYSIFSRKFYIISIAFDYLKFKYSLILFE